MEGRAFLKLALAFALLAVALLPVPEHTLANCSPPNPVPRDPPPTDDGGQPSDPPGSRPPSTPRSGPRATPTGRPGTIASGASRPGVRPGGALGFDGSWRVWWNFNREHILGLRGVTGSEAAGADFDSAVDPIGRERTLAREALLRIARSGEHEDLRAAALRALGREGSVLNAETFLKIMEAPSQKSEVIEGAAIGLAMLPRLAEEEQRKRVRGYLEALVRDRTGLQERSRLLCLMALSLRGRSDPALVRIVAEGVEQREVEAYESSALLLSAGLPRSDLSALFIENAAASGRIGSKGLPDVARAHAALALALAVDEDAAPTLLALIRARGTGVHTRRSAAIGLGRIMETGKLCVYTQTLIGIALEESMYQDPDPLVRGFSVIALGLARRPFGPKLLMDCLLTRGDGTSRPYAALALGLAARGLLPDEAGPVRSFLIEQFREARGIELPAALAIAIGLAGATEGAELLASRIADEKLNSSVRGPACQALGLLGAAQPAHERVLLTALNGKDDEVAQNAALGLGLSGGEQSALVLVTTLAVTRSEMVQAHMVAGLSHLGGPGAIGPLIELMENPAKKRTIRVSAATALGLIVSRRKQDPLFELDAYTNPYGMTEADRELALVF